MKSNIERRKEISEGLLPPKGSKAYNSVVDNLKKNETPELREFMKKNWEKVTKSLEAQLLSNCGLITEHSLRYFLNEFNSRAWNSGLRSMPIMFNVMEAFFNYRKPEMYFELIEEENYSLSFFDFIDFVTSTSFTESKDIIYEELESDLIYNFNVGKDLSKISFNSENGDQFIVAGVSIIRREDEVTLLMTTGRKQTGKIIIDKSSVDFNSKNPEKSLILENAKERLDKEGLEWEYLDEEKEYIKVLVACRFDLETMTLDARYIAEEMNLMFNVKTDEVDGFLNSEGDFISEDLKKSYFNILETIEIYNPIFEAVKYSMYLPYYFNQNEEKIIEESHETDFKKINSSPVSKRKYNKTIGYKCSIKSLFILDTNHYYAPDKIRLRDDLFKIQTEGYWKNLEPEDIGLDKKGNTIHGKTWVNLNTSWFEAKPEDLIVKKENNSFTGENAGYIYVLRNPTMEENIFKIGLTRNNVDERAKQLSKTSVPDKFYKSQEWAVKDCLSAEKEVHNRLADFRVDPRREFFKIKYDNAIKVIIEVVEEINSK